MNDTTIIAVGAPPDERPRRHQRRDFYRRLFAALTEKAPEWVSVEAGAVPGRTMTAKQTYLANAARTRGLRVETTGQDGRVFLRIPPQGAGYVEILVGPPLRPPAPRLSYSRLFDLLKASPSVWHSVPLAEVTGPTENRKTTSVLMAAKTRGLRVQVQIEGDRLYVRSIQGVRQESAGPMTMAAQF